MTINSKIFILSKNAEHYVVKLYSSKKRTKLERIVFIFDSAVEENQINLLMFYYSTQFLVFLIDYANIHRDFRVLRQNWTR